MQLNKKDISKKTLGLLLAIVLLIAGVYVGSAYAFHLWPFPSAQNTTTNSPSSNTTNDGSSNTPPNTNTGTDGSAPTDSGGGTDYVSPPLTSQPSNTDPYPIENERYKIVKTGDTSFNVTLYPIVNNPEYSNYNAQLKAYKNEVLAYLKSRYGSTTNLSINWSPSDAQNL